MYVEHCAADQGCDIELEIIPATLGGGCPGTFGRRPWIAASCPLAAHVTAILWGRVGRGRGRGRGRSEQIAAA